MIGYDNSLEKQVEEKRTCCYDGIPLSGKKTTETEVKQYRGKKSLSKDHKAKGEKKFWWGIPTGGANKWQFTNH